MNAGRLLGLSIAAATIAALADLGTTPAFAEPAPASASSSGPSSAYDLSLDLAGTGVVIDFSLDESGIVTAASTGSAATDAATAHEVRLDLSAATVNVELGDGGTSLAPIETAVPEADAPSSPDASGQAEDQNTSGAQDSQDSTAQTNDSQNTGDSADVPAPEQSGAPTPEHHGEQQSAPSMVSETAPEPSSTESQSGSVDQQDSEPSDAPTADASATGTN